MKNILAAFVLVLVFSTMAYGGWYVGPTVGYSYYAPMVVPSYITAVPYVAYSPVIAPSLPVVPVTVGPLAVEPMFVPSPMVIGPMGKVYIPGRPVRNTVRVIVP